MREPTETANHIAVGDRMFGEVDRFVKGDRAFLIGDLFRVGERKVEEKAQLRIHLLIESGFDGSLGVVATERIRCVHSRAVSKCIARKLIEQNHEGESAFCGGEPTLELSCRGALVQMQKLFTERFIKGCVFCEPLFGPRIAPKCDHIVRAQHNGRSHPHAIPLPRKNYMGLIRARVKRRRSKERNRAATWYDPGVTRFGSSILAALFTLHGCGQIRASATDTTDPIDGSTLSDAGASGDSSSTDSSSIDASSTVDASSGNNDASVDPNAIVVESLPSSKFHKTATWWGYNQSKIVRSGNRVVTYVLDNDVSAGALYSIVMYQKIGDGPWTKGANLPASAPGNLILEPSGQLSLFVFEAFNMAGNGAIGSLKRYTFATPGDITNYTSETIIGSNGTSETVNIRVGAAVGSDGTLYAGWGINLGGTDVQSEVLIEHHPGDTAWTYSKAANNLGHDFYYPYVVPTEPGVAMLAVQDDYIPPEKGGGNIYQITNVFERPLSVWSSTVLIDLRSHPLASTHPTLLQVSDLFRASDGKLHALTSLYLSNSSGYVTTTRHNVRDTNTTNGWSESDFSMADGSCNFVRLFEVDTRLMSLCQTYDKTFIRAVGGAQRIALGFPGANRGAYPFVAAPRGGTSSSEEYVDLMFISGSAAEYPNGPAYYARIPKSRLRELN